MTLAVTVQYVDGCPGRQLTVDRVGEAASRAGLEVAVRLERVRTLEDAARLGFVGSPTVLVEGVEVGARGTDPPGLACRLYAAAEGAAGAPSVDELERAMVAASWGGHG